MGNGSDLLEKLEQLEKRIQELDTRLLELEDDVDASMMVVGAMLTSLADDTATDATAKSDLAKPDSADAEPDGQLDLFTKVE